MTKYLYSFFISLIFVLVYPQRWLFIRITQMEFRIDTLNLTSVMIGPVAQPIFPLIDAVAFNKKTNDIAGKIMNEEQKLIEDYKSMLASNLNETLSPEIKTAEHFNSGHIEQYQVEEGIQIDNKNFPVVFFSDENLNFADF